MISGINEVSKMKLRFVKKDRKSKKEKYGGYMNTPVVLMVIIFLAGMIIFLMNQLILVANATETRQEILHQMSYLNERIASNIYDDTKKGTYENYSQSVLSSPTINNIIAEWAKDLENNVGIIYKYSDEVNTNPEKYKIKCGHPKATISNIDFEHNTVYYTVTLEDASVYSHMLKDWHHIGTIKITGSYTFNGNEDINNNQGEIAKNDENYSETVTEPNQDDIAGNIAELEQIAENDNLLS